MVATNARGLGSRLLQMTSWVLASGLLGACQGSISAPGDGPGGDSPMSGGGLDGVGGSGSAGSGSSGSGAQPGGGGPSAIDPGDPRIAPRIWRLTSRQFNDEVARLFGTGAPQVMIPETAAEYGITNIAENAAVDLGNASLFADAARTIAAWVVQRGNATTRCSDFGAEGCVDTFLGWFPAGAFRRPVAAAELAELRALFDDLRGSYEYDYAFSGIVRAVLLSPDFLYRMELGDGGEVMTGHEIANLMAFAITDQSPDDELLAAAESEDLTDSDVREQEARRLMQKSERSWQRFFWEWLQMSTLWSQGEEVGLDDALVAQMEAEYRAFVRGVVIDEQGTLREVLSASHTWVEPELAQLYGVDHPGGGVARVELDPSQRGGLLTQGAWLVSHGKRGRDNVVRRGMNIYKAAMCNNDLSPPVGVDVQAELAKLVGPDATVRETVDARGNAPSCGGCHRVADPVGMVFESFTSDGRWQDSYPDGRPVDTAITVDGIGDFDDARAFAAALVDDLAFQRCFVQRFAHFLVGVDLGSPQSVAWTQEAHERFLESDTSLEELLVAIVRHPAFVERRAETSP